MFRIYRRLAPFVLGLLGLSVLTLLSSARPSLVETDQHAFAKRSKHYGDIRVGVFEDTPYHDEVIGGVLTVMHDLQANTSFYRGGLHRGFEGIIQEVWDSKSNPSQDPNLFASHVEQGNFDVVVLVTCDDKFWGHRKDVIQAFSTRKDVHVVCLLHEIERFGEDKDDSRKMVSVPGEEGRLTFLTLSPHSTTSLRSSVQGWMDREENWSSVDVVTIAPVFSVTGRQDVTKPAIPSKAAILGRINPSRQYERIIGQLHEALLADPTLWGYQLETYDAGNKFIPLDDPLNPPFTLNLIGFDEGHFTIPAELLDTESPIVVKHSNAEYDGFYQSISEMDMILPAFTGDNYVKHRSSASIPAAIIAQTPVLADESVLGAYAYLGYPAYIPQLPSVSEIETIGRMRAGLERVETHGVSWSEYFDTLRESNAESLGHILERQRGL